MLLSTKLSMKVTPLNNLKSNPLYDSLVRAEEKAKESIPAGYAEIRLSTEGKLFAPEVFHVRDFKTEELLEISLISTEDLSKVLLKILKNMIYEKDVDPAKFHISEVEETLVHIYMTFFSPTMDNVIFPVEDDDLEYLKSNNTPESYESLLEDLRSKRWVPQTSFNIQNDVDTYDIPEKFKPYITIKNNKTGFEAVFRYLCYSDQLIINDFLDDYFAEQDAKFETVKTAGVDILSREDRKEYEDYTRKRLMYFTLALNYCSVVSLEGQDLSELSLAEKFQICNENPQLNSSVITILNEKQSKQRFGIKPEVRMKNPITGEICLRRFPFRVSSILQACILYRPAWSDDGAVDSSEYIVE